MWWRRSSLEQVSPERDDDDPERGTEEQRIASVPVLSQPGTSATDQPGPSVGPRTRSPHSGDSAKARRGDTSQQGRSRISTRRHVPRSRARRRLSFGTSQKRGSSRRSRLDSCKGDSPQMLSPDHEPTSSRRSSDTEDVASPEGANAEGQTFRTDTEFDETELGSSSRQGFSPSGRQLAKGGNVYQGHTKVKTKRSYSAGEGGDEPERIPPIRPETPQQPDLNIFEIAHGPVTDVPGPSEPLQRTREDYTSLGAVPRLPLEIETRPSDESINQTAYSARISPPTRDNDRALQTGHPLVPPLQLRSTATEVEAMSAEPEYCNLNLASTSQRRLHSVAAVAVERHTQTFPHFPGSSRTLVFMDVLMSSPERVMILVKRSVHNIAIFVLLPSSLTSFLSVYVLEAELLRPITSLYSKPPYNTHRLSVLVGELKDYLPVEDAALSEWSLVDRDMTMASIEIFKRNPEVTPEILFSLMAENLFTDINSMLTFFEDHYASYREEQLAIIRQRLRQSQAQSIVPQTQAVETLTIQVGRMSIAGSSADKEREQREKQKRYVETLKPPIRLPPLPSRPRLPGPGTQTRRDFTQFARVRPPTPAELARLQACYDRDGRPRIKSKPRHPETSEKDEQ